MPECILMRHGESEWNAAGRLAGTAADIGLTPAGREQARRMAVRYAHIPLHAAYTSELVRTQQTLAEVLSALQLPDLSVAACPELNERDCGAYTGRTKAAVRAEIGPEEFARLDRDWECAPPGGESMAVLRNRLTCFYSTIILPHLRQNHNVLIVSSYNPMRILKWYLQGLAEGDIGAIAAGNAEVCICTTDTKGSLLGLRSYAGVAQTE